MTSNIGAPRVLFVDATQNLGGWEHKTSARIFRSMKRRKVEVAGSEFLKPTSPEELSPMLQSEKFNCLLIAGQGRGPGIEESNTLKAYLSTVQDCCNNPAVKLVAFWTCGRPDPQFKKDALAAEGSAPIVLCSESDLESHEAFVFFSRFFEELALHCPDAISRPMARFSYLKTLHFAHGKMELRI